MITTLISFGILFIGIGLLVFYKVCDNKYYKTPEKYKNFVRKVVDSCLDLISLLIITKGGVQ